MPDPEKKLIGRRYHEGKTTIKGVADTVVELAGYKHSAPGSLEEAKHRIEVNGGRLLKGIRETTAGWWENIYGSDTPVVKPKSTSPSARVSKSMAAVATPARAAAPVAANPPVTVRQAAENKAVASPAKKPGVAPMRPISVSMQSSVEPLPQKLNTVSLPMTAAASTGRMVKTSASTQPGYEHMPEYSRRKMVAVPYGPGQDPKRQQYQEGTSKMKAGSYAGTTTPQVQGTGSNQSAADLRMMQQSGANAGAALRKVAPVGSQSYEDFQRTRHTPQGLADKDAYEVANKLPRLTDADYQQRRFSEGAGQVKKMAQANPGSSVFSGAPLSAAFAGQRDRDVRLGNYADTGTAMATAGSLADRSAKLPTQTAYVAPGVASGIVTKDLGDSTPMKKKMAGGPMLAKYAEGTKRVATSPFSEVDNEGEEQYDGTVSAPSTPEPAVDMASARKMRAMPKELPADRDAGKKTPADYKEAAAYLRTDKALMAQYHAGVASGKAFSLKIGGKTFKYAATTQKKASPAPEAVNGLSGGDIRKARIQEADELSQAAVQKMQATKVAPKKTPGTALSTTTSPQLLGEDAENAALRKQVRKMASRS